MREEIVGKYYGVNIIKSCGRYYPSVNGDIECKSINAVKRWIKDVYVFTVNNLNELDVKMNLPIGTSVGFINMYI